jgi:hypothetical protein
MRQVGREVSRYFIHQITLIRGATGDDGTGTDIYGEPIGHAATPTGLTLNARVEWNNRRVTNQAGEEVVCSGMVYLDQHYIDPVMGLLVDLEIGPQDRIIFEGREHAVVTRTRAEGWLTDRGQHLEIWIV